MFLSLKWFYPFINSPKDLKVISIEPGNNLYYWIEKMSNLLTGSETLFLIDDIIPDENLDKRRQSLLELAISGHHRGH